MKLPAANCGVARSELCRSLWRRPILLQKGAEYPARDGQALRRRLKRPVIRPPPFMIPDECLDWMTEFRAQYPDGR